MTTVVWGLWRIKNWHLIRGGGVWNSGIFLGKNIKKVYFLIEPVLLEVKGKLKYNGDSK